MTDSDYSIYEGQIGNYYSHIARICSTDGETIATLDPMTGDRYYLVVPSTALLEGSYGQDSSGSPRDSSMLACKTQSYEVCE